MGGSPWLSAERVELIRGRGAVICVNNSHQLAPWADCLYWADRSWLNWNVDRLIEAKAAGQLPPELITRNDPCCGPIRSWPVRVVKHDTSRALSRDPHALAGWCSGANALNLSFLGGAECAVLMGFEGRRSGNWHKQHKTVTAPNAYERYIVPSFIRMAAELKAAGFPVFNCTPESALSCFPHKDLGSFL